MTTLFSLLKLTDMRHNRDAIRSPTWQEKGTHNKIFQIQSNSMKSFESGIAMVVRQSRIQQYQNAALYSLNAHESHWACNL